MCSVRFHFRTNVMNYTLKILCVIVFSVIAISIPYRSLYAGVTYSLEGTPTIGSQSVLVTIKATFSSGTLSDETYVYITQGLDEYGQPKKIDESPKWVFSNAVPTYTVTFDKLVPETKYEIRVSKTFTDDLVSTITTNPWGEVDCTNAGFMCIWQTQDPIYTTTSNGKVDASISLSSVNIPDGTEIAVFYKDPQSSTLSGGKLVTVVTAGKLTFSGSLSLPLSELTPQHTYNITTQKETVKIINGDHGGNLEETIITPIFSTIPSLIVPTTLPVIFPADKTPQYCLDHPDEYCLLEPIPQFGASVDTSDLQGYFTKIISLILMLGSAFAVLMIVYGGVLYMGSESVFKKGEGLAKVEGAIFGLLLLVGAYSILNSINPSLVNLEIKLRPVTYNISYEEAAEEASTNTDGTYNYGNCKVAPKIDEKCPTCRPLSEITVVSSGKEATDTLADKLELFNQSIGSSNWRVTEAYAPSPIHCAQCHYNGTCIDAGLNEKTVANIKSFYDKALAAGLGPVYEVLPSQTTLYNELTAAGVKVIIPKKITAPHFSVYCKPGVTNGC